VKFQETEGIVVGKDKIPIIDEVIVKLLE